MTSGSRKYLVATDVGGTCTDTVVFAAGEPTYLGKALSTPPHFAEGVLDSLGSAADSMGITMGSLIEQTALFVHGSTVVDNAILSRDGARVGLLTTEGFEDTLLITRGGYGRWAGLTEDRMKNMVMTDRAAPLVSRDHIIGLPERTDYRGAIIRELADLDIEIGLRKLIDDGVEAVAVAFLWSFYNPTHERRVQAVLERLAPGMYCTLSSDIAPSPGSMSGHPPR